MHKTAYKSGLFGILLVGFGLLAVASPGNVRAQADETPPQPATQAVKSNASFTFQAAARDNLTLMARRSVQLYAANQNVEVSTARLIAAETYIVQKLGSFPVNIGQSIEIPESVVAEGFNKASNLSPADESRWLAYAPVDEDITHIRPVSAPQYVQAEQLSPAEDEATEQSAESNDEQANNDQPTNEEEEVAANTEDQKANEQPADNSEDAPWYWWVIGAAAIAAMWYILGGNEIIARQRKRNKRSK